VRPLAAVALLAVLVGGSGSACDRGDAPRCRGDSECAPDLTCEPVSGVCVGFPTPLLSAPDAAPDGSDGGAGV
jgi:hypothetical protein